MIAVVGAGVFFIRYYEQQKYACPTTVRSAPLSIPTYPNAQQEHPIMQPGDGGSVQHIGFQTADSAQAVIAFYKDRLKQDGWLLSESPGDTLLRFGHTEAVPLYSLDIEVTPMANAETSVRVRLWSGPCLRA